ncbi:hypothetical protein M427DRAFT_158069, partial [Gonapodya prolifera JEL478]
MYPTNHGTISRTPEHETMRLLYSIIVGMNFLELSFLADNVTGEEYQLHCDELIQKQRLALQSLARGVPTNIYMARFMKDYGLDGLGQARHRFEVGVNAQVEHPLDPPSNAKVAPGVAMDTTKSIIKAMDSLALEVVETVEKTEVLPHLSNVSRNLSRYAALPPNEQYRKRIREWLIRMSTDGYPERVPDEDTRALTADLKQLLESYQHALERSQPQGARVSPALTFELAKYTVTAMDALDVGFRSKQDLQVISRIVSTCTRIPVLQDGASREAIMKWVARINALGWGDSLSLEEAQQLKSDLESLYEAYRE